MPVRKSVKPGKSQHNLTLDDANPDHALVKRYFTKNNLWPFFSSFAIRALKAYIKTEELGIDLQVSVGNSGRERKQQPRNKRRPQSDNKYGNSLADQSASVLPAGTRRKTPEEMAKDYEANRALYGKPPDKPDAAEN